MVAQVGLELSVAQAYLRFVTIFLPPPPENMDCWHVLQAWPHGASFHPFSELLLSECCPVLGSVGSLGGRGGQSRSCPPLFHNAAPVSLRDKSLHILSR